MNDIFGESALERELDKLGSSSGSSISPSWLNPTISSTEPGNSRADELLNAMRNNPFSENRNGEDYITDRELLNMRMYFIKDFSDNRRSSKIINTPDGVYYLDVELVPEKFKGTKIVMNACVAQGTPGKYPYAYRGMILTVYDNDTQKGVIKYDFEEQTEAYEAYRRMINDGIDCEIEDLSIKVYSSLSIKSDRVVNDVKSEYENKREEELRNSLREQRNTRQNGVLRDDDVI